MYVACGGGHILRKEEKENLRRIRYLLIRLYGDTLDIERGLYEEKIDFYNLIKFFVQLFGFTSKRGGI